jgi:ADP-ribosylglycohydrolase
MTSTWSNVVRGVAVGDSWGWIHEFKKIDGIIANNPKGPDLPAELEVTDDTQMTLYLAAALDDSWNKSMGEVKDAIVEAYLEYYRDPDNNRAPGNTVMSSLGKLARGGPWQDATSTHSDGSGTVMRTSPTAFLPEDRWVGVSAFAAALTHGTANGVAAAILNAAILRDLLDGEVKPGALVARAWTLASDPDHYGLLDVGEWLDGYEVDLQPGFAELARLLLEALVMLPALRENPWEGRKSDPSVHIGGGGWRAHETIVIALLALDMFPGDGWEGLRRSVVSDGDSDTIGAVAGGLVGAAYPGLFIDAWYGEGKVLFPPLRERFESRYVAWIEEADQYALVAPKPRRSWLRRLVG